MSEETKFTPGPWEACRNGECPCRMVWNKPYDMVVAVAIAASDEQYTCGAGIVDKDMLRANSLLIAAAPELYEALSRSLNWLSSYPGGNASGVYEQASAALKKARGEV